MTFHVWKVTAAAAVLFAAAATVQAAGENRPEKRADAEKTVDADTKKVTLKVRSWKGVQKRVGRHEGKVVLVNVWTTTCLACIEEFPNFVALGEKYPREKLALVSLNCDYDGIEGKPPSVYREKVLKFLREQQATFDNVMLNVSFLDFLEQIDLSSTPAILVYGPDGKLVKRFDNDDAFKIEDEYTLEDVKQLIDKLLAEKRP